MSVEITQFGGHIGSTAGDCAVVAIDDGPSSLVLVIDTGASSVWKKSGELAKYARQRLPERAKAPIWLITTHFHEDHYNLERASALKADQQIYSDEAWVNAGKPDLAAKAAPLKAGANLVLNSKTCRVCCYAPPAENTADQNDQSMAVEVTANGVSFLSFGDMTCKAYERLTKSTGPLPLAGTIKYPHHGNPKENYLPYFEQSLASNAVLISGDSRSGVGTTIQALLERNVGAVYLLARTPEAKAEFRRSWTKQGYPVYLCEDVKLTSGVEIVDDKGWYLGQEQGGSSRRTYVKDVWKPVEQDWSDDEMAM